MLKIAVAHGAFAGLDHVRGRLADHAEVREIELVSPERLSVDAEGADALVVTLHPLTAAHFEAVPSSVKVIGRAGIGLDSIDLDAALRNGVSVINQPDYATAEVATHAVAMMLAVHRRLLASDRVARADWAKSAGIGRIYPIEEQTIGLLGCGRIGSAVIERIRPFAGNVLVFDPRLDAAPPGARLVESLDVLLASADIMTLHLPINPQTRGIIGARALATLPEGAIVVNVSRGGLIDEDALIDALDSGRLAGAALDVTAEEPIAPESRLLTSDKVLLSPHVAWYSEASAVRLRDRTFDGIMQFLSDQPVTSGNMAVNART